MPSIHEQVIRETVNRLVLEGDPVAPTILETAARMNDGFYWKLLQESVVQKHRNTPCDQYDAYAFLNVLEHLYTGELLYISARLGVEPRSDRAIEANDAALKNLKPPLRGSFHGGLADSDGQISWDRPIRMVQTFLIDDEEQTAAVEVPPASVPLEVGTTAASRSLVHIRMQGGLARWRYGSPDIDIFFLTEEARRKRAPFT